MEEVRHERQQRAGEVREARDRSDLHGRVERLLRESELLPRHEPQPQLGIGGDASDDHVDLLRSEAELAVDLADLLALVVGHVLDLPRLARDLGLEEPALRLGGHVGAHSHGERAGEGRRQTTERDRADVTPTDSLHRHFGWNSGGLGRLMEMAVYTELGTRELAEIVDDYGLAKLLAASGIAAGSVNTSYLLETARGKHLLRIDEVKSELEVKRELDLLLFLRKHGFPCPQPIADRKGRHHREMHV